MTQEKPPRIVGCAVTRSVEKGVPTTEHRCESQTLSFRTPLHQRYQAPGTKCFCAVPRAIRRDR